MKDFKKDGKGRLYFASKSDKSITINDETEKSPSSSKHHNTSTISKGTVNENGGGYSTVANAMNDPIYYQGSFV